jgi:hypothetical protein
MDAVKKESDALRMETEKLRTQCKDAAQLEEKLNTLSNVQILPPWKRSA